MDPERTVRRLVGSPRAIRAHAIGRTMLLELLARDAAVLAIFQDFPDVVHAAEMLAAFDDPEARASATERPRQLTDLAAFHAALDHFLQQTKQTTEPLRVRLEELVFDRWRLDWVWLVVELMFLHQRMLGAIAFGGGWAGNFRTLPTTLPSAPAAEPGETATAYVKRLRAFYRKPPSRARSKTRTGVRVDEARIRRDMEIFYRLAINRESVNSLAKQFRLDRHHLRMRRQRAEETLTNVVPLPLRRRPNPPSSPGSK